MDGTEGYIPLEQWGEDHWSTLLYVDNHMLESKGFQIGTDARMRTNRTHFRTLRDGCPRPKRWNGTSHDGVVMKPENGTHLLDGTVLSKHDDWMCVQDMAALGFFSAMIPSAFNDGGGDVFITVAGAEHVEPGNILYFNDLGFDWSNRVRRHKMRGGTFKNFGKVNLEQAA